jgi:hypothetical protein
MVKYMVVHCKHEGCYDFQCYEDEENQIRLTSIRINPPKIFMFDSKDAAHNFMCDYISEVDIVDNKCKKGEDIEHEEYCTCGMVEQDEEGNPILFYNKKNQIFFIEDNAQVFGVQDNLKNDIRNYNMTNRLLRGKYKRLDKIQKEKYIELGELCKQCIDV